MTDYRIVCTDQPHCHIVAVGTGEDPNAATTRFTVAEVWSMIDAGHFFYTYGGGKAAAVRKYDCPCGMGSLRSAPDAISANNLDELRYCSW